MPFKTRFSFVAITTSVILGGFQTSGLAVSFRSFPSKDVSLSSGVVQKSKRNCSDRNLATATKNLVELDFSHMEVLISCGSQSVPYVFPYLNLSPWTDGDGIYAVGRVAAYILVEIGVEDATPTLLSEVGNSEDTSVAIASVPYVLKQFGSSALPWLVEAIQNEDPAIRGVAAETLGLLEVEDTTIISMLVKTLNDSDETVRRAAEGALNQIGPASIPELTKALRDEDPDLRRRSAAAIDYIGIYSIDTISYLIELLSDSDPEVRDSATRALSDIALSDPETISKLINNLYDEDQEVRERSAYALGEIGSGASEAIPTLIEILETEEGYLRSSVIRALGKIGSEASETIPLLVEILQDDSFIREGYTWVLTDAIARMGSDGVNTLFELIQDDQYDSSVRSSAITSLAAINSSEAIPVLFTHLKSEDPIFRIMAISGLAAIGSDLNAVPIDLIDALQDPDPNIRELSAFTLGRIESNSVNIGSMLANALNDEDDDSVRANIASALPKNVLEEDLSKLILALQDTQNRDADNPFSYTILDSVSRAIGEIGYAAVPELIILLKNEDETVKKYAINALGYVGYEAINAVSEITKALKDENPDIRRAAIIALGNIGPGAISAAPNLIESFQDELFVTEFLPYAFSKMGEEAVPVLIIALQSDDPATRRGAAQSLELMGTSGIEAIPYLKVTLQDSDKEVRRFAASAIWRVAYGRESLLPPPPNAQAPFRALVSAIRRALSGR